MVEVNRFCLKDLIAVGAGMRMLENWLSKRQPGPQMTFREQAIALTGIEHNLHEVNRHVAQVRQSCPQPINVIDPKSSSGRLDRALIHLEETYKTNTFDQNARAWDDVNRSWEDYVDAISEIKSPSRVEVR
jgi:hypothetical protein